MQRLLQRRLLGTNGARNAWLDVMDECLPRLQAPTTAAAWTKRASQARRDMLALFFAGHPAGLLDEEKVRIQWRGIVDSGEGYRVRKLRYEGYPGMWIPALLYEPTTMRGRVPAVLNPNGHHAGGKAMDYKQARCINLARRGMLALNTEFIGMGELRADVEHLRIAQLDLCGVAGIGVFYLAMKRGLDVLLQHRHADPERVAMTGLSGGGWQTAILSALDERIRVVVPVAGHSALWQRRGCPEDIGDLEQCPNDLCTIADYDVLTGMFAPRPTLLIYNRHDDCCFQTRRARVSVYRPAKKIFDLLGAGDNLQLYDNTDPGTHNYEADNRSQLYRFLNHHFGLDTPEQDVAWKDGLRTEEQLRVGLPADNATLLSLAEQHKRRLQNRRSGASLPPAAARRRLRKVLRLPDYEARPEKPGARRVPDAHIVLQVGPWRVPVTVVENESGSGTEVVIADGGRPSAIVRQHVGRRRIIAVDLFGTGEAFTSFHEPMLLASAGQRPLGIQVAQLLAVSAWASRRFRARHVHLFACGRTMPVVTQIAAALEPKRFASLTTAGALDSLERLIDLPLSYGQHASLFCFGLLAEFDIVDLQRLSDPVPLFDEGRGPLR